MLWGPRNNSYHGEHLTKLRALEVTIGLSGLIRRLWQIRNEFLKGLQRRKITDSLDKKCSSYYFPKLNMFKNIYYSSSNLPRVAAGPKPR